MGGESQPHEDRDLLGVMLTGGQPIYLQ